MQQQEMEKKKEKKSILTANQKSDAARQEEQTTAVRLSDRPNGQKRFGGVLPVWGGQRSPERLVLTAAGQQHLKGFTLLLCLPTGRWGWSHTGPRTPPTPPHLQPPFIFPYRSPPPSRSQAPTHQTKHPLQSRVGGGWDSLDGGRGGQRTEPEAMSPPTL